MTSLRWWLSVALCAGLGRAVGTGGSTSGDVTCTDITVSTNLLSNPSWEDGLSPWSYYYPRTVTTAQASDGSQSLLTSGVYPFQYIYQTVSGLVPGTTYQASTDFKIVITNAAIQESCSVDLYHDSATTANLINQKTAIYNMATSSQWLTLSGPFTATAESHVFGIYITCSPYRVSQVAIYVDNAKFLLETPTQVCTTTMPTSTPSSTPPASTPSTQPSSPVSSIASSSPVAQSSSAILIPTSTPTLQSSSAVLPSSVPSQTPSASTPVPKPSSSAPIIAPSSPILQSSSAILIPTSTPTLQSSSAVLPSSVPSQTPSASTPVPKPSSSAPIIAPSSPILQSSSAILIPTSTPTLRSSSAVLPSSVPSQIASASTPVPKPSSAASSIASSSPIARSSSTPTSIPVASHTSASSRSRQCIKHPSTSATPSAPPSVSSGSTSLAATTSTKTSTELQSTSTVASFSTTVISTELNQQPSATGPVEPHLTPSPIDLPPPTSSGQITPTNVALTTSTIYSTRTSTITACPSSVINCPARSQTTYVTTETIYVSTTVCPVAENEPTAQVTTELASPTTVYVVTEKVTSLPTGIPFNSVSVSPIFSTRTATFTSCPPNVVGCSANPAAPQVVTETLLVRESTYTLSETAVATYTTHPQIGSTASSRLLSSVPVSYTTLSVSSTLPHSSTSTSPSDVPAFNSAESLGRTSLAQIIVSVSIAGLALLWL